MNQDQTKKKVLGKSSYKNSKQKKKIQQKKSAEAKKLILKDRQLKVKIKHLEKELERIKKVILDEKNDKKINAEKSIIEKKIASLQIISKKKVKITKKVGK
jgi:hypothetical protein